MLVIRAMPNNYLISCSTGNVIAACSLFLLVIRIIFCLSLISYDTNGKGIASGRLQICTEISMHHTTREEMISYLNLCNPFLLWTDTVNDIQLYKILLELNNIAFDCLGLMPMLSLKIAYQSEKGL